MRSEKPKIIVVVGPTASGKSDFAVDLALKNNGEIISADSRQVYKYLDIGTGKITEEEMKGIKHYMLSIYELDEEISVARFARDASPILKDILSRNKTPIICGGTGQYIDSLIFNNQIPQVLPNKKLRDELENLTTEELVIHLQKSDPERLSAIDIHNRPRLIRALEIVDSLGKVPKQKTPELLYDTKIYLLNPTREILRERITKRLEKRLAIGMIDEVKNIMEKGYTSDSMKKFGLEYVSIAKYLENNPTSLESPPSSHEATKGHSAGQNNYLNDSATQSMKQEIITKSMQYAKRQQTWNKKYIPIAEILQP